MLQSYPVMTMDLEHMARQLLGLLVELSRAMRLVEKSEVGCCGITLSQCHLLLEVDRRAEGASLSEVAPVLGLDLSTVSRVADGLVRRGLIRREADPQDRRRAVLFPTDKGRALASTIRENMHAYTRAVLEQIPPGRRPAVLEGLSLLAGAVQRLRGGCCRE